MKCSLGISNSLGVSNRSSDPTRDWPSLGRGCPGVSSGGMSRWWPAAGSGALSVAVLALMSHASKVTLKILQAGLQQYENWELPMFKLNLEKEEEPETKLPTSIGITEEAREFQKNIYFCFIDYAKAFDCVDHNKLENSERDGNTRPPDLPPEKSVCRSRSNS